MIIIWNESRGLPNVTGDVGCAIGLMQIHTGGKDNKGKWCRADNRVRLPEELRILPSKAFLDPETNLTAGAILLSQFSSSNAFLAAVRYAGCEGTYLGKCSSKVLRAHMHWWRTGLNKRIEALEAQELLSK